MWQARVYPLRWARDKIFQPDYGWCFAWKAASRSMAIDFWVLRTPDHRYELWILGPGETWEEMKAVIDGAARIEEEATPIFLGKVNSAPSGKMAAQAVENALIRLVKHLGIGGYGSRVETPQGT